ncbi:MAG: D-alanyl-D-alanine carboxypeptidase/D-alanyl-D-alanine-endopeptidase [Gemmatimonadetes bacterium]|nr:D-alanyl-D-alanine carboxypeptidase/D-alanyl-D-alanine-endopeptidase [Gemmatimonadota bacterium]
MVHSLFLLLLLSATGGDRVPVPPADGRLAAPAGAASAHAVGLLRSELEQLLRQPGWHGNRWGVLVVSLDRGDTLFAHQPDVPLAPASNMKLFTAAAALYYLGPQFRYSTFLMTDGLEDAGVLRGDLILYGTGDPTLSDRFYARKTSVWEEFADALRALGITRIEGDVVGDASYFGGPSTGLGWQESYMNAWYAAPATALAFNDNVVTLRVRPAAQPGWRPELQLVPGGEGIAIVNQATTVRRGRSWIDVNRAAYDGPIVVRGQISRSHRGVWRTVPVADPARYAAAVLRQVLEERGIQVTGAVRSVQLPEDSPLTGRSVFAPAFDDRPPLRVLAVHRSPPLLDILEVVNKRSHNLYAELVLRTVGRVALGDGTVEGGGRAARYILQSETGAEPAGLQIFDGSGLSVLNRASAGHMVQLLRYMAASTMWEAFWSTLPEAGEPGGLRRMYRTAAERNLRAKTGTIDRVSALSGYVRAGNGERLAFSILSNNVPSTWKAKRIEDAIGTRLAEFRRPPQGLDEEPPVSPAPIAPPAPAGAADAAPITPDSAAAPRFHSVRAGETLTGIARRWGTTVDALRAANSGVDPRRIRPGQKLRLPTTSAEAPAASGAADRKQAARAYVIRRGDTLEGIARRHRLTVEALRAANPGVNPRRLMPGRKLRLPPA